MDHFASIARGERLRAGLLVGALAVLLAILPSIGAGQKRGQRKPPPKPKLPPAKSPADKLKALEWFRRNMPTNKPRPGSRLDAVQLDRLLEQQIGYPVTGYAELADSATLARRIYLDLLGRPPLPEEIDDFAAEPSPSATIDRLLDSPAFAVRWGGFWRDVILSKTAANKNRYDAGSLQSWLSEQLRKGAGWDQIAARLLVASGKDKAHGPDNFVLAAQNKPDLLAAETARVFMGIQIQCAECHDHPFDRWKRVQFHRMAALFARGKYMMPDQYDPDQKSEVEPRFLLGERVDKRLSADHRRVAVAAFLIYNPDNYWFARSYVNRVWNELMGDGFYAVDSLGPDSDCIHKLVVNRMAYVFRFENFDPKWVFRTIMNSRAYRRQLREPRSQGELFTGVRPIRLRPDQIAESVDQLVGSPVASKLINSTFATDLSIPHADVTGSIQQALLLMNNPALQKGLRNSPLKKRLVKIESTPQIIQEAYRSVLARSPTNPELERWAREFRTVRNRGMVVDDLLWVLMNCAEFTSRR